MSVYFKLMVEHLNMRNMPGFQIKQKGERAEIQKQKKSVLVLCSSPSFHYFEEH